MKNYPQKLMLFDLSIRGHHPSYIRHLIEYWQIHKIPKNLEIVVSCRFMNEHQDVVELSQGDHHQDIRFVPITQAEEEHLNSRKSKLKRLSRNFQEWEIFCKYATNLRPDHCLIMYFDTCQIPLALGAKSPCTFSGIYFRPTFHYHQLDHYDRTWKNYLQQLREKIALKRILANPQLQTVFCLDPFAVPQLNQFPKFPSQPKAVYLPDPVKLDNFKPIIIDDWRKSLQIDSQRRVFLLFGALTARKGIYQLLDSIASLPADLCQKLCILLVGESSIANSLDSQISEICQTKPIQIIRYYQFVPESEVMAYFQIADVVLAPYQRHVGMSGILLLAAAANKPVLCSNYGLMGEMVRRYHLGLTVDSSQPQEIAKGLIKFLEISNPLELCDPLPMQNWVKQNSASEFSRIIFEKV
ncbi:glycosyltransferase family 4 protein [Limnospira maxima]|nr:glycosyltransferase [Limnospira maxima]MDC0836424.1 glycosyltransferase [Limnoraphis robusta]